MTKAELELKVQELELEVQDLEKWNAKLDDTISRQTKKIEALEQEKRNLASANSENASKYVSARDEIAKLKKRVEELEHQPQPDDDVIKKLQEQIKNERQVSTEQLLKLHNYTKRVLDQLQNICNASIDHYNYIVKDIESY